MSALNTLLRHGGAGRSAIIVRCCSAIESSSPSTVAVSSTWIRRDFSASTTASAPERSYRLLVLGGGTAGCAIASKFVPTLGKGNVAVVDPAELHYYQSLFTMVGAGMRPLDDTYYPMEAVLPKDVDWIRDTAETFQPERNQIITGKGDVIKYDYLVVALGLQLNYNEIKNATEALQEDPSVVSIYSPKYVTKVRKAVDALKSGNAIFTFPHTGIKCAGAAQKICYLSEEIIRQKGLRQAVNFFYNTAPPVIFTNAYYAAALEKLAASRNIQWNKQRNLIEVRPDKKEAVFAVMNNGKSNGQTEVFKYSMLHIAPPMSAPRQLWNSPLVDSTNYVDVNSQTLQHVKYKNIYALGDCANTPTSKTAAACASQVSVVGANLKLTMDGGDPSKTYDGYTSCPLLVNHNKVMLAEFGYDGTILETFPVDQRIPRISMYLVKNYMMPTIYWKLMVRGMWHGPRFFRKLWRFGL